MAALPFQLEKSHNLPNSTTESEIGSGVATAWPTDQCGLYQPVGDRFVQGGDEGDE